MTVTPCMGVWIETKLLQLLGYGRFVTPCMGVWIETEQRKPDGGQQQVTPCMGVWIETQHRADGRRSNQGHTLYGCVD